MPGSQHPRPREEEEEENKNDSQNGTERRETEGSEVKQDGTTQDDTGRPNEAEVREEIGTTAAVSGKDDRTVKKHAVTAQEDFTTTHGDGFQRNLQSTDDSTVDGNDFMHFNFDFPKSLSVDRDQPKENGSDRQLKGDDSGAVKSNTNITRPNLTVSGNVNGNGNHRTNGESTYQAPRNQVQPSATKRSKSTMATTSDTRRSARPKPRKFSTNDINSKFDTTPPDHLEVARTCSNDQEYPEPNSVRVGTADACERQTRRNRMLDKLSSSFGRRHHSSSSSGNLMGLNALTT